MLYLNFNSIRKENQFSVWNVDIASKTVGIVMLQTCDTWLLFLRKNVDIEEDTTQYICVWRDILQFKWNYLHFILYS